MNIDVLSAAEFQTIDLTELIGTEISASVETLLSGRYADRLRELLSERSVLVFRELHLDDQQQKTFTETLGQLALQKNEPFMNISLDKAMNENGASYLKGSWLWHIDMLYWKLPNKATLLTARVLSDSGGDTEFASTYAAWDSLPEMERQEYEGLQVVHAPEAAQLMLKPEPSLAELQGWRANAPSCEQPLVWTHRNGRKSLLIGATASHIVGKSVEQSRTILTRLRDWTTQPRFVYRHKWTVGDLVVWDNTGSMHRALPYPEESGRLMRRTTLKGEEVVQ